MTRPIPLDLVLKSLTRFWPGTRASGAIVRPNEMRSGDRAALLIDTCLCIRANNLDAATAILNHPDLAGRDGARLNLLGVICEKQGRWANARDYYGLAMRVDRRFAPPQVNMRRFYELDTFGRTTIHLLLGDEGPTWWKQRMV